MKDGKNYTELSKPLVPKTIEEEEKIKKRGEKTKSVILNELCALVKESTLNFPRDNYLTDMKDFLKNKKITSFGTRDKLVDLFYEVEAHVDNLTFQNELKEALGTNENSESDDEDSDYGEER